MDKEKKNYGTNLFSRINLKIKPKLIVTFLVQNIIPIVLLVLIAYLQISQLGIALRDIAVKDSTEALNKIAKENIERLTTDTASKVADFLYQRDADLRFLSRMDPSDELYETFIETKTGRVVKKGDWAVAEDGASWVPVNRTAPSYPTGGSSSNTENDDAFNYREPDALEYEDIPLYNEIVYIEKNINDEYIEKIKVVDNTNKINYPLSTAKNNLSEKVGGYYVNTYVKAESYVDKLKNLTAGEIYVSDVIGAYTRSNYIGMYTESIVSKAAIDKGYAIDYVPEEQAFAGEENPYGKRFEGIVRFIMPVMGKGTDENKILGYISMALNHDHIMEMVDHITPMVERYKELSSAFEGNYAFIWDYNCRSIAHPRHHSIVGYDPNTGKPQVPWLENSIYTAWKASDTENWFDYTEENVKKFDNQSRKKTPAAELTKKGLVGLDGRYLNNAPQCTGWMDLTRNGGSGLFNILWSGIEKPTTAAAIPYYTGQYSPDVAKDAITGEASRRGFGFVAIGAGLEDFNAPASATKENLEGAIGDNLTNTILTLVVAVLVIIILIIFISIVVASSLTGNITGLVDGISRFRAGARQFRFNSVAKDEFGMLADSFDDMAQSIENSVTNPLVITDMNRNLIYMNESGLKLTGTEFEEVQNSSYKEKSVYPLGSKYDPIEALNSAQEAEIYYHEKTGTYVKGNAKYLKDHYGNKIGYIIETIDMTQIVRDQNKLKDTQTELEKAVIAANSANSHKGEFLARMSHEIRTPMNAIIGVSHIVLKKLGEEMDKGNIGEIKNNMHRIESSSQHLLGLLNDILDISKIEAGKIELSDDVFDINELTETVNTIIRPRCDDKKITFKTRVDNFDPGTFKGDALRLRQVLINLLGNAVKFTPECGEINFTVEKLDDTGDGKTLLKFSVKDNGIGIGDDVKDNIFKPFEQSKNITAKYGGTGLGLAISQNIVKLFGGEITLESELNKGSTFSFEIWLNNAENAHIETELTDDVKGKFKDKRILLVDDVEINRIIVSSILEETGAEILEADDGLTAVEKFAASKNGEIDLILMDVKMVHLDGYGATAKIRAMDRSDAKIVPIIALTANAFKDDIDAAHKAGMNAHLSKPIEPQTLFKMLFKYLK